MDLDRISALINDLNIENPFEISNIVEELDKIAGNLEGKCLEKLLKIKELIKGLETSENRKEDFLLVLKLWEEIYESKCDDLNLNKSQLKDMENINLEQNGNWFDIPSDSDIDIIRDFITESKDNISRAEQAILKLETNPDDKESINSVFRMFHTLKGTSSFLGLNFLSEFAHKAESLLSKIRDGIIKLNQYHIEISLKAIDLIKEILESIEKKLDNPSFITLKPSSYDEVVKEIVEAESGKVKKEDSLPKNELKNESIIAENKVFENNQIIENQVIKKETEDTTIRIKTEKLDRLIDMIGELAISYSMLSQDLEKLSDNAISKKTQQIEKIIKEVQEISMSMRMIPIKNMFQKMIRLTRDLSKKVSKDVVCHISGEETEVDRNMINTVEELLVHMVRNSIDHGIETPDERIKKGKPKTGNIYLRAYNADGNVVFEIEDDGRGIDKERIKKKAIEKGLIKSDTVLSDDGIYNLIFLPGFSTADKVSDISGRGVGMDVVKKGIDNLRGKIEIKSIDGSGTIFKMKFPLTLAITDSMLVEVGGQRYAIPVNNVEMLSKKEEGKIYTIEGKGEIFSLRGEIIPVFRLNRIFGGKDNDDGIFIIFRDGDRKKAIVVDNVLGKQQIVIKPLLGLKTFKGILGGCILGDGKVAVIIDPQNIIEYYRGNNYAGQASRT